MFFDDQCTVGTLFISPIESHRRLACEINKSNIIPEPNTRNHLSPALFHFKAALPLVAHQPFVGLYHIISPLLKNSPELFC